MTATATRPGVPSRPPAGPLRRHPRVVLALLVALCLAAGAAYALLGTRLAAVGTVQVTGTREVPASAVVSAADVPLGTPMVRLDAEGIRRRVLAALADVGSVSVQRSWPATVRLVVRERAVAMVVPQDGQFLLVDRTGVAFRLTRRAPAGAITAALPDPRPDDPPTRAVLAVLADLRPDVRGRVLRVTAPTPDQITLALRDGRTVFWGGPDDGRAKAAVVAILLKRKGTRIDVSAPSLVTVR